jgi:GT2 family glycosyltransferase
MLSNKPLSSSGRYFTPNENLPLSSLVISIVSHGQGAIINKLLEDLQPIMLMGARVILTLNIPEDERFINHYKYQPIVIRNKRPLGFGCNHNNAFKILNSRWFAVLNPDIRLEANVFNDLIKKAELEPNKKKIGLCAPEIKSPDGNYEDNARKYPTTMNILRRIVAHVTRTKLPQDYKKNKDRIFVDWVSGCFMLFNSESFNQIGGFDTKFFMYLEDADICRRLCKRGFSVSVFKDIEAIHDARRSSRKNLQHFFWHLKSLIRFLISAK